MRAVVMAHKRAKGQGQRSFGAEVKVETDGQTDGGDCITSRVDAIGNKLTYLLINGKNLTVYNQV